MLATEPGLERAARPAREAAQDTEPAVERRELAELGLIERQLPRAGVIEEADFAGEILVAERPQHRHNRGDPAATADEQHTLGPRLRQDELARSLAEPDDLAR